MRTNLTAVDIDPVVTLWTPHANHTLTLTGFVLTSSVAGNVKLQDGSTVIFIVPCAADAPVRVEGLSIPLAGNLRAVGPTGALLSGHVDGTQTYVQPVPVEEGEGPARGMYVWGYENLDTSQKRTDLVAFCTAQGVSTLFLAHYDIIGSTNDSLEHRNALRELIGGLKAANPVTKVYATSGDTGWALDGYDAWTQANIVDKVIDYNGESAPSERFDGFHYDIEYWVPDDDPATAFTGLKAIYDGTVADSGLPVGFFAAFYLTDAAPFLFNGKTASDGEHFMDLGDHVVVGSYRNQANPFAEQNGQIELMADWVAYGEGADVWAGALCYDSSPAYTTYFGGTKAAMETQIDLLDAAYEAEPKYKGTAIEDYEGWVALS